MMIMQIDFGINIYAFSEYILSDWTILSKALGMVNTTRLLFFIADTGVLKNIFRNLSRGFGTIFLIFVYFATWIYLFAIVSYFIYNPFFFQNSTQCPECVNHFGSLESSFLTGKIF